MANILVFNYVVPYPPYHSGNTLRVFHLSREIARHHRCFLAAFGAADENYRQLQVTGLYENIVLLPDPALVSKRTAGALRRFVEEQHIDLIIAHTLGITQYLEGIDDVAAYIVDLIDSRTLAAERRYRDVQRSLGWFQRLNGIRVIHLLKRRERHIVRNFPFVTTVSPIDKARFVSLDRTAADSVHVVPNGVSPHVVEYPSSGEELANSIAFFGTLDFPPNSTAVYYFYERVFLPYLEDQGIIWYIVGRRPEDRMLRMAREHGNIVVTGEVEDIFGLISRIPIVVNPMRIGGGLKNKVLEGLALRRVVISNGMGIEAIEAIPDVHYVHADTPEEFAAAIAKYLGDKEARTRIGQAGRRLITEKYTWDKVAGRYLALIDQALSKRAAGARQGP